MHRFPCLFGSVWLGKKNSWHFQWTHRCSIIQWPQKANSDLNTHNNSILLELTLFYCLAKFGVGVGRCSYSYRLYHERKGVCKLQRGIRWKKQKNTHNDNKAQIWNLFWVTEEEPDSTWHWVRISFIKPSSKQLRHAREDRTLISSLFCQSWQCYMFSWLICGWGWACGTKK